MCLMEFSSKKIIKNKKKQEIVVKKQINEKQ